MLLTLGACTTPASHLCRPDADGADVLSAWPFAADWMLWCLRDASVLALVPGPLSCCCALIQTPCWALRLAAVRPAPSCRPAALAWEAAFLELARTQLADMASAANLSLTFSAERSIRDEIDRETYTDMSTVALSYIVMLLYIACALGTLPHRPSWRDVLVHSRAALGLGGVLIVGASVVGALGLCSAFGLWSALINLEVGR